MSVIEPDEDGIDEAQELYELWPRDRRLIKAAIDMCLRMAGASGIGHNELLGLGFAVYALRRLPQPTAGLEMDISVATPLAGSDEFKIKRTWSIAFETDPAVRLSSGGWVEIDGFGDSFSRFEWYAMLGCEANFADYTEWLLHLDAFGYWPEEVPPFGLWVDELTSIQPSDGYSIDVELHDYPADLADIVEPDDRETEQVLEVSEEDEDY